jgi:poly-gamma-glutamate capsule biosynthesis protein CapA/YwtB (metallophosphatase superfamily)
VRRTAVAPAGLLTVVLALGACTSAPAVHRSRTRASGPSVATITLPADTGTAPRRPSPPTGSEAGSGAGSGAVGHRRATVLGSGDVLIHPPLWEQARADARAEGRTGYDFGPMYASITPDVRSADLATCEMETPLAPPQGPFVGWPDFSAPPQVLTALKGVGYTTCTTASNHSLDQGYDGLKRTLDELDAAGLRHTGSARSAAEAATPLIATLANGVRIGQLAYSFNFNGHEPAAGRTWEANLTDVPRILAAAKRMKAAGADIVVLSLHWGTEYDHRATALQQDQARRLLASPDIDLILGDHAHVVQPAQKINDKWVFYCMGNQISRHEDPVAEGREGIMPKVTFTEVTPHHFRTTVASAVPTWMEDEPALRLVDLPRALASSGLSAAQRQADRAAHAAIVRYLDAYGAVADGLRIV